MKLDPSQFTTNFHPYDCGILGELENYLLPSYLGDEYKAHHQRIFVELYKLNVSQFWCPLIPECADHWRYTRDLEGYSNRMLILQDLKRNLHL